MDTLTVQVWKLDFTAFKSPAAKLVALALARRGRESGACWAKQATLANDCGVSKQTIHRCLEELEQAGWLTRDVRFRNDGGRTSDIIWLTLPAVTLQTTTVDRKEAEGLAQLAQAESSTVDLRHDTVTGGAAPPEGGGPDRESQLKESLKDSKGRSSVREDADQPEGPDVATAVDLIWQRASKIGRGRSSKADIEKALRAALERGNAMERILRGLGAYFASPDAVKEDGAFQRGAHVMLANDRWASFLDDDQARAAAGETVSEEAARITEDLGTLEAPSAKRQRVWMDLFSKGMAWDPERGPMPGRQGCRVDPAIQLEYGTTPYGYTQGQDPDAGDGAAFD